MFCKTCEDGYYTVRMVRRGCGHEPVACDPKHPAREPRCPDCGEVPEVFRADADELLAEAS